MPIGYCSGCQKDHKTVHLCTRCREVSYCNRECQARHWKAGHKKECLDVNKLTQLNLQQQQAMMSNDLETAAHTHSKILRQVHRQERKNNHQEEDNNKPCRILQISMTAFGMVAPGMPLPEGVPAQFHLKQQATTQFQLGPPRHETQRGNFKGEFAYKQYYDDLVQNEAIWMTFFSHPDNMQHTEHTCGILGTLATLYRQRGGCFEDCEKVLDMEVKVLAKYKQHAHALGDQNAMECVDHLEYKLKTIRYNLYSMPDDITPYHDQLLSLFRDLCQYELQYQVVDTNYLFLLPPVCHKPPTAASLRSLTRAEILKCILVPKQFCRANGDPQAQQQQARAALAHCDHCGKPEPAIDTFKQCTRCQSVVYCGRDCQRASWKQHKKKCGK